MGRGPTSNATVVVKTPQPVVPTNATAGTNVTFTPQPPTANASFPATNASAPLVNVTGAPGTQNHTNVTLAPEPGQPAEAPQWYEIGEDGKFILVGVLSLAALAGLGALWYNRNEGRVGAVPEHPIELTPLQSGIDELLAAYDSKGIALPNFALATEDGVFTLIELNKEIENRLPGNPADPVLAKLKKAEQIAALALNKSERALSDSLYTRTDPGAIQLKVEKEESYPDTETQNNIMRLTRNIIALQALAMAWRELSTTTVVDDPRRTGSAGNVLADNIARSLGDKTNLLGTRGLAYDLAKKLSPDGHNITDMKEILNSKFRVDDVKVTIPSGSVHPAGAAAPARPAAATCNIL